MNLIAGLQKDWKRTYAFTVVYGYMYDIIFWPLAFWGTTIFTALTGVQFPAPPLVPWEQLAVAAGLLVGIGAVQFKRDQLEADVLTNGGPSNTAVAETETETKTITKLKAPKHRGVASRHSSAKAARKIRGVF